MMNMEYVGNYINIMNAKNNSTLNNKIKSFLEYTKHPLWNISSTVKISVVGDGDSVVEYYERLSNVKYEIKVLEERLGLVESLHLRVLNSTVPEESKENIETLNSAISCIEQDSKSILEELKNLNLSNVRIANIPSRAEERKDRIKQHAIVGRSFLNATSMFRELQDKYKNMYKERMRRHISITNPEVTQEELDQITDKLTQDVGKSSLITAIVSKNNAYDMLEHVQWQNKELLKLEQSIMELYHLFTEMGTMLSVQSDCIADAELKTMKTKKNAYVGAKELQTGIKYHKRSRKKLLYVGVAAMTLMFIILVAALLKIQL